MSKVHDGIIGLCVGDALGVPVEFLMRQTLRNKPLTDMIGYGTHSQPAGTWSDDSSLVFCLMESAVEFPELDLYDIAERFVNWMEKSVWTPHGVVFDIGNATAFAIERYKDMMIRPDLAGGTSLQSNGNGSLMRILPLAYWLRSRAASERMELVSKVSSITHGHPISKIACVIYVELAIHLIDGLPLEDSLIKMRETVLELYKDEKEHNLNPFKRVLKGNLAEVPEEEIASSGYVVDTLEASLWCLLTTSSYSEAVLRAVNLGEDTDTTGAVTGGLAGLIYGEDTIPAHWISQLVRLGDIQELCQRFEESIGVTE
ncbi:ADP-ribosylglycohydrolase family protein [Paenibacillus sinopodophylli]|uniref:ADP-ribosylglycohydrolase family protein n=1 Tax=Paenibacillus sinopodophylli TaxID=1837342 RepID=UPI00110D1C7D|nr:ADP-ribosylglycohydrolase family protein [Paenibacillus sinopodophylli]